MPKVVFENSNIRLVETTRSANTLYHKIERRTCDSMGVDFWRLVQDLPAGMASENNVTIPGDLYKALLDRILVLELVLYQRTYDLAHPKQELSQGKEQQSFEP